jgi:uncharacterized protein
VNPKSSWNVVLISLAFVSVSQLRSACAAGTGPSFNCASAKTDVEKAICKDVELSESDREMAMLFEIVISQAPENRKNTIRQAQRKWLTDRDACVPQETSNVCLYGAYSARLLELRKLARVGSLQPGSTSDQKLLYPGTQEGFEFHASSEVAGVLDAGFEKRDGLVLQTWPDGDFTYDAQRNRWVQSYSKVDACPYSMRAGPDQIVAYYGAGNHMADECTDHAVILTNRSYAITISALRVNGRSVVEDVLRTLKLVGPLRAVPAICDEQ